MAEPASDRAESEGDSVGTEADLQALARIESELADVEVVLACLEAGERRRCDVCVAAERDGTLDDREALKLCSLGHGLDPD